MTKVILHTWAENSQVYNCLDALLTGLDEETGDGVYLDELREVFALAHDKPGERIYLADGIQSITVFTKLQGEEG